MKIINVFTNKTDVSEKLSVTLKEILEKKNFSVSYDSFVQLRFVPPGTVMSRSSLILPLPHAWQ